MTLTELLVLNEGIDPRRQILLKARLQDQRVILLEEGVLVLSECRPKMCNATERRATRQWYFGTDADRLLGGSVLEGVPCLS